MVDALHEYLNDVFGQFLNDPPDSEFQKGYLAAMLDVAKENRFVHVDGNEAKLLDMCRVQLGG